MVTLPFNDVMSSPFFCQIAEAYFSGLANGTSSTTYSPGANVTREQMAAFTTRTQDSALRRGSRRAALGQWWTPASIVSTATTDLGQVVVAVKSDGEDIWVAGGTTNGGTVARVHASDGRLLGTWTGAVGASGVLVARGRIYVDNATDGILYSIDPKKPPGPVTTETNLLGTDGSEMAFDGARIWVANTNLGNSLSIVSFGIFGAVVTQVAAPVFQPANILFDGSDMWVTGASDPSNTLARLDLTGAVIQTFQLSGTGAAGVFDGTNLWVPNGSANSVTVVRVKDSQGNPLHTAFILATLTGNGLNCPAAAAFDGQRILVTNSFGNSISLWKATDLTPIGSFSTGANTSPSAACSDGVNFWIALEGQNKLARF
jgi:hypothetical protein